MRYLYKITNLLNNKVYIGQSYSEIERWRQHKYAARSKPRQYIDCAIKKYGEEHFTYEVIAMSLTQENCHLTEIELIKQYNSRDRRFGYNVSAGGDEVWNKGLSKENHPFYGKHHSDESRKKISEALSGEKHHLYGKHHSNETLQKMSDIKTDKIFSEEHKSNISKSKSGENNPWFGITRSEETRQKMSKAHKGKTHTLESKVKMSDSRKGKSQTEETKQKISLSLQGENAPNAKLSNNQRLEIIEKRKSKIPIKILMEKYGVSKQTIIRISKKK
jgi:group I intron endonuclease